MKYKGPGACMECAPQSRALPALYSLRPWGHREWFYYAAPLKMLSSAMASKEAKSVFYYCLVLVSLVCTFCGFIKLSQKESLYRPIALGDWIRSQLEVLLLRGQPAFPAHLWQDRFYLLPLLKMDPGTYHFQRHTLRWFNPRYTASPARHTKVHVLSHQIWRPWWKP